MMSHQHPVAVRTMRRAVPLAEPLSAYVALAGRYGQDQTYLLESAGGPAQDCRSHFIGFHELLSVSVEQGAVTIDGHGRLPSMLLARIQPLLEHVGPTPRLAGNGSLWELLRAAGAMFTAETSSTEFDFGFIGYFGYDAAHYIEDLPYLVDAGLPVPDVHLVLYQGLLRTDLETGRSELLVHQGAAWPEIDPAEVVELLSGPAAHDDGAVPAPDPTTDIDAEDDTDQAEYLGYVDRALGHIAIGDIYQVQIGHELSMRSPADPVSVYRRLRSRNASPYMYLAPVGGRTVIGASPELFVRVLDGLAVMRPIAGTLPRGTIDDEAAAEQLRSDPKEIAEHVMLVDLCRNDIGRICQRDTLAVPEEMAVSRYSHVLHLVSTVTGQVEPGMDSYEVIAALFPSGTMTGAPKIRAMEIIESMEHHRRGFYAGALGLIGLGGYLNLALCIRTLVHHEGTYRTRASAGVVSDSDAHKEWTETLAKSSATYWAVTGRELLP
jgi:anthranilate/para-aminobenzoate synthase component I